MTQQTQDVLSNQIKFRYYFYKEDPQQKNYTHKKKHITLIRWKDYLLSL